MDHPSKFQSCNDWSQMSDAQPCLQGHLIIRRCPEKLACQYKKDLMLYSKNAPIWALRPGLGQGKASPCLTGGSFQ